MPKMKTHKSASKRYKISATGKLMRRRAFHSHLLTHKTAKRKRNLKKIVVVNQTDLQRPKKEIPYAQYIR